jgi:hypothetical protein
LRSLINNVSGKLIFADFLGSILLILLVLFIVITCYSKRKVREIEEKNHPGGNDKWKIKGKQSWKRAKERRH